MTDLPEEEEPLDEDDLEAESEEEPEQEELEELEEPEEPQQAKEPARRTAWTMKEGGSKNAIWLAALMFGVPLVIIIIIEAVSKGCGS